MCRWLSKNPRGVWSTPEGRASHFKYHQWVDWKWILWACFTEVFFYWFGYPHTSFKHRKHLSFIESANEWLSNIHGSIINLICFFPFFWIDENDNFTFSNLRISKHAR